MSKSEFIRSLQFESKALSPFDISQRLRQQYSCVSVYQGDPKLDPKKHRGYMTRFREKPDKTPENPELYVCIIASNQPKSWQDLVWTKEILHILDRNAHWTQNKNALGHMLDNRTTLEPHDDGTPLNVKADKNGVTLALGCKVPHTYRTSLRKARPALGALEGMLLVPAEYCEWLLTDDFETHFGNAVGECDH
jgi:hypothetical protein